jgi:succinyl-diaminopimelate desuccinylase
VRLVPGVDKKRLMERFEAATGGEIAFDIKGTSDPVWTDPDNPWIGEMAVLTKEITGVASPIGGATYFTDAAALKPAMGNPPTIILGPGEPDMAHQTDEFCYVDKIEQAEEIYLEAIRRWCRI